MTHLKKKAKWQKHQLLIFSQIANFDFNNAMSPKSFCKSDWRTLLNSWGCTLENFHFHNIRLVRLVKNSDLVQNPCLLAWLDKAKNRFSHFLKKKRKKFPYSIYYSFGDYYFIHMVKVVKPKTKAQKWMNPYPASQSISKIRYANASIWSTYVGVVWFDQNSEDELCWRKAFIRHVYLTLCTVFENHR